MEEAGHSVIGEARAFQYGISATDVTINLKPRSRRAKVGDGTSILRIE